MTIRNWIRKWRGKPYAVRFEEVAEKWRIKDEMFAKQIRALQTPEKFGFTCGQCGKHFECPGGVVDFVALANHSPCSDNRERATELSISKALTVERAIQRNLELGMPIWKRKALMKKLNRSLVAAHFCYLLVRWSCLWLTANYGRRY